MALLRCLARHLIGFGLNLNGCHDAYDEWKAFTRGFMKIFEQELFYAAQEPRPCRRPYRITLKNGETGQAADSSYGTLRHVQRRRSDGHYYTTAT
jgi:hypothetical protein